MNPKLVAMRETLVDRGWITADTFRLTEEGYAETDRILAYLKTAPPPKRTGSRVHWK